MSTPLTDQMVSAADLVIGPTGEVMKDRDGPAGAKLSAEQIQRELTSDRSVIVLSADGWQANFQEVQ